MKKYILSLALLFGTAVTVMAQTLNVVTGNVTYQFPATDTGEMTYTDAASMTIMGKTFAISDITRIYVDAAKTDTATVAVVYDGTTATVTVSGDIARYITPTLSGAHVNIAQSSDVDEEITYKLSGNTQDGEFYTTGSYKATVALSGLTLTNATPVYSGAAICIMNGKRIDLSVKSGTTNVLTDCAAPSAELAQKAALYCKGHLEIKGQGELTVNGKYAHGIKSAEYMQLRKASVTVAEAAKDGISCDEYFLMESGTLNISGVKDDGVQCDIDGQTSTGQLADHEGEDSGNIYIEGGTLNITTTAAGTKGIKAGSTLYVNDGALTINASGAVDTSDSTDPAYVAALNGDTVVINGGTIKASIQGNAGRGIKGHVVETNGGTIEITNSATTATVSSEVKGAKGIKGLNVALNAGTITINMKGAGGKGIRAGDGTQSSSGGSGTMPGGGGGRPGGGGGFGGDPGGGSSQWTNITGSYTQGRSDGTGPALTINCTGSYNSSSSNKAIKAICAATLYGGTSEITTTANGAEGLESKTSVTIAGGMHYFKCYDDCINSSGKIYFNGGVTVAYSTGNDAIDSNAGTTGAITIGDGAVMAYTTKGSPEEAFDCDNNSYIQITGKGYGIGAGGAQSSISGTISNAAQGYSFAGSVSYKANVYNTLADASGKNLVTYMFPVAINSTCTLITADGMVKGSSYNVKSSSTAPTDATIAWHGLYLGSSAQGTTNVISSLTAK